MAGVGSRIPPPWAEAGARALKGQAARHGSKKNHQGSLEEVRQRPSGLFQGAVADLWFDFLFGGSLEGFGGVEGSGRKDLFWWLAISRSQAHATHTGFVPCFGM